MNTNSPVQPSTLLCSQDSGHIVHLRNSDDIVPATMMVLSTNPDNKLRRKISVDDTDNGSCNRISKKLKITDMYAARVQIPTNLMLLAQHEDENHVSTLHIFIREQIEVFCATITEIEQPAPGRKIPIQVKQVGLRCIHCRSVPSAERAKRAICYPSSVGRVYNSVSDMKFDHFPNCKFMPEAVKTKFLELKSQSKSKGQNKPAYKSSGVYFSTSQYYHDSAQRMGLVTDRGGVFFQADVMCGSIPDSTRVIERENAAGTHASQSLRLPTMMPSFAEAIAGQEVLTKTLNILRLQQALRGLPKVNAGSRVENAQTCVVLDDEKDRQYRLHTSKDSDHLTPIHCFVRRHVEFFAANHDDLTVPSPGRKTPVILGQVGIRCVHCARLSVRERVKRSVCYPASVRGIYHSVSNMKFDHFVNCKGLPESDKEEFVRLRNSCQRGRKDTSAGSTSDVDQQVKKPGNSNSTAQFYHDSALQLGLVDTVNGIRFATSVDSQKDGKKMMSSDGANVTCTVATVTPPPQQQSQSQFASQSHPNDGLSALMIAAMVRLQSSPMKC